MAKVKKMAIGGLSDLGNLFGGSAATRTSNPVDSGTGGDMPAGMTPNYFNSGLTGPLGSVAKSGGGSAQDGLGQVSSGASTIANAIGQAQGALGGGGGSMAIEGNKAFKKGGKVSSASRRGDGIAQRGKTRGRMR